MSLQKKVAVILLGGDVVPTPRLQEQINLDDAIIIAADGGIKHAAILGLTPNIWLGDFDSKPAEMDLSAFQGDIETHNRDKAQTDGALAIEKAIELGAQRLILVGALSGERSDHMLMHMTMALSFAVKGYDILMTSGIEEAVPIIADKSAVTLRPDWPKDAVLSLVGYTDLLGVTLKGMRWPLDQHDVPLGDTLTLSNETTGPTEITLEKGRAIAMVHNLQNSGTTQ